MEVDVVIAEGGMIVGSHSWGSHAGKTAGVAEVPTSDSVVRSHMDLRSGPYRLKHEVSLVISQAFVLAASNFEAFPS